MYFLTPVILSLVAANVVNNNLDFELNEPFKRDTDDDDDTDWFNQVDNGPKDADDIEAFSNVVGATQTADLDDDDEYATIDYAAVEESALAEAEYGATALPTDGAEASMAAEAAHAAYSAGSGLADVTHSWQMADQDAIESAAQDTTEAGQSAQVYNTQAASTQAATSTDAKASEPTEAVTEAASTEDAQPSDVSLADEQNRNDVISSLLSEAGAGASSVADAAGAGASSVADAAAAGASSVEDAARSGASSVEDVARSGASSVEATARSGAAGAESTARSAVANGTNATSSSSTSKPANSAGKLSAGAAVGGVFFAALLL